MKAVICPVCCGRGTIVNPGLGGTTTVITEVKCHGCYGCGWVCVPGDEPCRSAYPEGNTWKYEVTNG